MPVARSFSSRTPAAAAQRLSFFDIKKQYSYLAQDGTDRYFDILIGAYLLNPLKNDYDVEAIASEHLGRMLPGRSELLGKLSLSEAAKQQPEKFRLFCCYNAYVAAAAAGVLEEKPAPSPHRKRSPFRC